METTSIPCPACSRPLPGPGVAFDHLKGRVYGPRGIVTLTPQEADVLEVLRESWPNVATRERLFMRGWPVQAEPADNNLSVVIHKLRKRLDGTGIVIKTVHGAGFRPRGYFLQGTAIVAVTFDRLGAS